MKSINVGGMCFVYWWFGVDVGVLVIFLYYLGVVLDNWDLWVVDGIVVKYLVVIFDNCGVGVLEG